MGNSIDDGLLRRGSAVRFGTSTTSEKKIGRNLLVDEHNENWSKFNRRCKSHFDKRTRRNVLLRAGVL